MISIVDYGMGNLRSVEKALTKLGHGAGLISSAAELRKAQKLILPGVGAFGDAMRGLHQRGLIEPIREYVREGRPLLGICLGLQIFFDRSEEDPGVEGLGLIAGCVRRFADCGLKIPHMGWNNLRIVNQGAGLLHGIGEDPYVYFVHSYHVVPEQPSVAAALTHYGESFVAAVESHNVCGTQFHPEKSQAIGLRILNNFAHAGFLS